MNVYFRRSALKLLTESRQWYEKQRTGLGAEFSLSIEACVNRIMQHPESFPIVHKHVRKANAKRFPYTIFYAIEQSVTPPTIVVFSCLHTRQKSVF